MMMEEFNLLLYLVPAIVSVGISLDYALTLNESIFKIYNKAIAKLPIFFYKVLGGCIICTTLWWSFFVSSILFFIGMIPWYSGITLAFMPPAIMILIFKIEAYVNEIIIKRDE